MGVPMGVDVCYTNHAEADQDDMDALLTLLVAAGVNFVMGVPGADDVMLGYQSTSFHDALAMRDLLGRRPAPEFEAWLERQGLMDAADRIRPREPAGPLPRMPVAGMTNDRTKRRRCGLWADLRRLTAARIGLKRTGASLATGPLLDFQLAHARARDAVHEPLDEARLIAELGGLGVPVLKAASAAADRQSYLMRPDLGRRLAPGCRGDADAACRPA